jgi:hypothetical protein
MATSQNYNWISDFSTVVQIGGSSIWLAFKTSERKLKGADFNDFFDFSLLREGRPQAGEGELI